MSGAHMPLLPGIAWLAQAGRAVKTGAPAFQVTRSAAVRVALGWGGAGSAWGGSGLPVRLGEMEATPHSGQCSRGRPTFVELTLAGSERLFGRR